MGELTQKLIGYIERRKTERERIREEVEKEDFLLSQIDEFREKAKQLQNLLASKESKVQELQEIVDEREEKAKELSDILEERQDAADRVVAGVGDRIDDMVAKVDAKLNELNETFAERLAENAVSSTEQCDNIKNLIDEQNAKLTETVESLNGQFDKIKSEICEKVHTEDVKCYRNIQTLFEDADKRMDMMKAEIDRLGSVKKMLKVITVVSILNLAGLAAFVIYALGII
ncbi:MAG: hypothetical protein J6A75_11160 [Lachnospiraceae bacterium]|nr:hypothetical protein [Lachnospiraceae bacterium]MBO5373256.1 hypothetical protein [Lachnospiraceae bacterium]